MAQMVLGKMQLRPLGDPQLLPQRRPQIPHGGLFPPAALDQFQAAGEIPQEVADPLPEGPLGVPVVDDVVQLAGLDPGHVTAPGDSVPRKIAHVFLVQKPFFFDQPQVLAVPDDRRGRVVGKAVETKNMH